MGRFKGKDGKMYVWRDKKGHLEASSNLSLTSTIYNLTYTPSAHSRRRTKRASGSLPPSKALPHGPTHASPTLLGDPPITNGDSGLRNR